MKEQANTIFKKVPCSYCLKESELTDFLVENRRIILCFECSAKTARCKTCHWQGFIWTIRRVKTLIPVGKDSFYPEDADLWFAKTYPDFKEGNSFNNHNFTEQVQTLCPECFHEGPEENDK